MRSEQVSTDSAEAIAAPNGAVQPSVIEQVRELLFGEAKRGTEQNLTALEHKLDELAATMQARFSEVESRLAEAQREAERSQASAIDGIGAAIAALGANIRDMSGARKPG